MNLRFEKQPGQGALTGLVRANAGAAPTAIKINFTAVAAPTVNDDSSAGYGLGSQWCNTAAGTMYFCADASVGAAVWRQAEAGSFGTSLKETITIANAFASGNVLRKTSTNWAKAQADTAANARSIGVVESMSGGTSFVIVYSGKVTVTGHGFTVGATLYLDPATAGLLTATAPSTVGQVVKPVAIVLDANSLIVLQQVGIVVPVANLNPIEIFDDGVSLTAQVTSIDITGAGITATVVGDAVTLVVNAPGIPAYDSGNLPLKTNDITDLIHGLPYTPFNIELYLICISADIGYGVGDIISWIDADGSSRTINYQPDATKIRLNFGSCATNFTNLSGAGAGLVSGDSSKWRLIAKVF